MRSYCFYLMGLFLLPAIALQSQTDTTQQAGPNLVPNPGFELFRTEIPVYDLSGAETFRKSAANWTSPTKTTPDLHLRINDEESEQPRSGQAMTAILTHNPASPRSDTWREYLQIRLTEGLKEGEEYY